MALYIAVARMLLLGTTSVLPWFHIDCTCTITIEGTLCYICDGTCCILLSVVCFR